MAAMDDDNDEQQWSDWEDEAGPVVLQGLLSQGSYSSVQVSVDMYLYPCCIECEHVFVVHAHPL